MLTAGVSVVEGDVVAGKGWVGAGGRIGPRGLGRGLRWDQAGGIRAHRLPGGLNLAQGIKEVRVRGARVKIHLLPLQSVAPFAKQREWPSPVGIFVAPEEGGLGLQARNLGTSQPLPHLS